GSRTSRARKTFYGKDRAMTLRSPLLIGVCGAFLLVLAGGAAWLNTRGEDVVTADTPGTGSPPGILWPGELDGWLAHPSDASWDLSAFPLKEPPKLSTAEWKKRYPFVSVAARLDYEASRAQGLPAPSLSPEAAKRLDEMDRSFDAPYPQG